MPVSRAEASEAMMQMIGGAEMVSVGIPQHLLDHPELDNETREILEAVLTVIPILCSVTRQSFLNALDAEDALIRLNEWIAEHEKK